MKSTWLACLALIGWGCSGALRNPEPVNLPAAQPAAQPAAAGAPAPATPAAPVSVTKGEPVTPPALQTQAASATVTAPAVGNAQSNAAPTSVAGSPDLIGTVGGQSITVADLLGLWMQRDSLELFRQVKHLIANRMVDLEAARLGIPADPELAERRYKESVEDIEKTISKQRPGVKLDDFVSRVLGLDPLRYRERLRSDAAQGVLAERCVRAFLLENEHAQLRMIAVQSEDLLHKVQAALAAGTDFAAVAKEFSVDPSSKQGGRMAGVVKSESLMGRLAFQTPVGEVSKPEYAQGVWLVIKVEARPAPLATDWKVLGPAVAQSLAEWGIDDVEYKQWEAAMEERYRIDLKPLMNLSGQVAR